MDEKIVSIRRKSINDGTTISKKMKRTIYEGDSNEENKAKFEAKNRVRIRREHKRDTMRMPETTSAQEVPQRITASRRENPTRRKNSRTSLDENKVEMQDITRKYKVVNYMDKNLEWNTEFIEAMELEHVMSQAAQDLNDGETRHESWKAQAHEHEYLPEREEVQWTKHANTSSSRDDS